jgi:hypothetical protein
MQHYVGFPPDVPEGYVNLAVYQESGVTTSLYHVEEKQAAYPLLAKPVDEAL